MHESSEVEAAALTQAVALELGAEMFDRRELECRLAAAKRVAAEAMRMLTADQLGELRRRLDVLEAGGT